jgi:hypothetical protein
MIFNGKMWAFTVAEVIGRSRHKSQAREDRYRLHCDQSADRLSAADLMSAVNGS